MMPAAVKRVMFCVERGKYAGAVFPVAWPPEDRRDFRTRSGKAAVCGCSQVWRMVDRERMLAKLEIHDAPDEALYVCGCHGKISL